MRRVNKIFIGQTKERRAEKTCEREQQVVQLGKREKINLLLRETVELLLT